MLSTHLLSFWLSIFTHLKRRSRSLLLCMFLGSRLVNKYKQMDCLTQQSIRIVRGQQYVSTLMSIMWNPIKWRAFRATYGLFHHVNNAMSSVIGAWQMSDWIVVYGLVDAQQGWSVMDTKQSLFCGHNIMKSMPCFVCSRLLQLASCQFIIRRQMAIALSCSANTVQLGIRHYFENRASI